MTTSTTVRLCAGRRHVAVTVAAVAAVVADDVIVAAPPRARVSHVRARIAACRAPLVSGRGPNDRCTDMRAFCECAPFVNILSTQFKHIHDTKIWTFLCCRSLCSTRTSAVESTRPPGVVVRDSGLTRGHCLSTECLAGVCYHPGRREAAEVGLAPPEQPTSASKRRTCSG